jgi:HEAT repeat protein
VRPVAARALGILEDKESADALSVLVKGDPDVKVRLGALQSLGWLKSGAEAIKAAKSDQSRFVRFVADVAEAHRTDSVDHAAKVRAEYDVPLTIESMDRARVGQIAPDFSAVDTEGNAFQLSKVVGKSIVVLDFLIADF